MLQAVVTGDESWFNFYTPPSKRDIAEWRAPGQPATTKPREVPSAQKRMLSVFWDMEGVILMKWLEKGKTINAQYYCEVLKELREAIKSNRRGKLSKGILLQHDNARPHTAGQTLQAIDQLGFTTLPHPPYSPDLAPSDYWLFSEMKKSIRGKKFENLQQMASSLSQWVSHTPESWFAKGIQKLPERWMKCIREGGRYVEIEYTENPD